MPMPVKVPAHLGCYATSQSLHVPSTWLHKQEALISIVKHRHCHQASSNVETHHQCSICPSCSVYTKDSFTDVGILCLRDAQIIAVRISIEDWSAVPMQVWCYSLGCALYRALPASCRSSICADHTPLLHRSRESPQWKHWSDIVWGETMILWQQHLVEYVSYCIDELCAMHACQCKDACMSIILAMQDVRRYVARASK